MKESTSMSVRSKIVLGLTAAAVSMSAFVPVTAQAATPPGSFTFYNVSNAPESVKFPSLDMESGLIPPGQHWTFSFRGNVRRKAVVYRLVNGHPHNVETRWFWTGNTVTWRV
jgi:hypothetical protein